jgi:alpha-beta hydrolase superfamily lysophospholipase
MKKTVCILLLLCLTLALPGAYAAGDAVSRLDFVTALNETMHIYAVLGNEEPFTDLTAVGEAYYELTAAKRQGYLLGYPDGTARPDAAITRAECAVALNRLLPLPETRNRLPDRAAVPQWAAGSVQAVLAAGIMTAGETGFRPADALTADELDAIVAVIQAKNLHLREDSVREIASFDGYTLTGRLSVPAGDEPIDKLVIFVHGTGPNTYEQRRRNDAYGQRFKVQDFYADRFARDGTAYFSSNTRGVSLSDVGSGPLAPDAAIDGAAYAGYTPQNAARDIPYIIDALKAEPRLKNAKVYLLGLSEGTVIAPLSVAEYGAEADALLLCGYCNDNMMDVLRYQLGGGMDFFRMTVYFDAVGEERITRAQFEADPNGIAAALGLPFETFDADGDGALTLKDYALHTDGLADFLFDAVERGDGAALREMSDAGIFPPLPPEWFAAHFELGGNEDVMAQVDTPLYIFHGTYDANCPVQGVYDLQERFEELGKENLTVNLYEGYDHELNIGDWITGAGSEGLEDVFKTVEGL